MNDLNESPPINPAIQKNIDMCDELLAENNLYEIYKTARRIPLSTLNRNILVLCSILSILLTLTIDPSTLAQTILVLSSDLISIVLTVLGFLIAGYAIFCSVLDHELSIELYESKHKSSGFSKLKHSHLLFMRVFFYYLVYTFFLVFIQFFSSANIFSLSVFNDNIIYFTFHITNYLTLNLLFIGIVFLLLQLASFTFNIYHSVMTSICYTEINK